MDTLAYEHAPMRPHRRNRRRILAALLLGSTVATVGAGASSLAYFSSGATNTGSWSSGTIILGVSPSTAWTATGIMPGDTGSQTITVSNSGTGDLRYTMATVLSNETKNLSSQLSLGIRDGACPSTGTSDYAGAIGSAALTARTLAAGTSEQLCFTWTFASAADNTYQAAGLTATFNFAAVQTKNNP